MTPLQLQCPSAHSRPSHDTIPSPKSHRCGRCRLVNVDAVEYPGAAQIGPLCPGTQFATSSNRTAPPHASHFCARARAGARACAVESLPLPSPPRMRTFPPVSGVRHVRRCLVVLMIFLVNLFFSEKKFFFIRDLHPAPQKMHAIYALKQRFWSAEKKTRFTPKKKRCTQKRKKTRLTLFSAIDLRFLFPPSSSLSRPTTPRMCALHIP